jgi:tight adherence protein C
VVSVSPTVALGLAIGLALGLGLWSLVSMVPRLSRPRLVSRVAPYVLDVSVDARELHSRVPSNPLPVFGILFAPLISWLSRAIGVVLGGTETIAQRLRQAGSAMTVSEFRSRQVIWSAAGAAVGVAAAVALARNQHASVLLNGALVALCAIGAFVLRDFFLQREAKLRMSRMASELPTVLEFLTLSLSAGEGILDAIRRISKVSSGELARELAGVVAKVNTGLPFAECLQTSADELQLQAFSRCVEQIVGALDRGTPLVEVLRAQAQDSRELSKRELLEVAGRKEVAMLVPLIFLILPMTIAFAIFPGIFVLQLGF